MAAKLRGLAHADWGRCDAASTVTTTAAATATAATAASTTAITTATHCSAALILELHQQQEVVQQAFAYKKSWRA